MNNKYPLTYLRISDKVEFKARTNGDKRYFVWDHENNQEVPYSMYALRKNFKARGKENLRLNIKKFQRMNDSFFKPKQKSTAIGLDFVNEKAV